jgi:hypothetical protein
MRRRCLLFSSRTAAVPLALGLALGLANGTASAADPASTAQPAATHPTTPELARLAALAGRWSVRQSMWTEPSAPPVVDRGRATFTAVLGGRHLRQELQIDAAAKPFQGLGYLGYDDAASRYDSLWMDVNFNGTIMAHGSYDAGSRTYTFRGDVPDPAHAGSTLPLREVLRVTDADHFTFEYYERHAGAERLAVRLEYARLK